MKNVIALAVITLVSATLSATDVQWTRFRGKVKGVNQKVPTIMLENKEGDLVTVKIDADVLIYRDKTEVAVKDVSIDDKVVLVYVPKAPTPKDPDEPTMGGVYPSLR